MYHESNVRASTGASPILSPAPSSATLSTQQWPPAAVPSQIANGPDRGEALQLRKRLLTSTALQILVGLCPAPLASRSDNSTPNQEGVAGSPRQEPPRESKRIKRPHAVEEAETDAVPNDASTCCDAKGADVKASLVPQGVSWPRPRLQVGWKRVRKCRGAEAPARQTLRVYLLPEGEQAQTHVQVCVINQTGVVGVLRAYRTVSGCYVVDLNTLAERLGQPSLPIAARVRSPAGQLLRMALLLLETRGKGRKCRFANKKNKILNLLHTIRPPTMLWHDAIQSRVGRVALLMQPAIHSSTYSLARRIKCTKQQRARTLLGPTARLHWKQVSEPKQVTTEKTALVARRVSHTSVGHTSVPVERGRTNHTSKGWLSILRLAPPLSRHSRALPEPLCPSEHCPSS